MANHHDVLTVDMTHGRHGLNDSCGVVRRSNSLFARQIWRNPAETGPFQLVADKVPAPPAVICAMDQHEQGQLSPPIPLDGTDHDATTCGLPRRRPLKVPCWAGTRWPA